MATKPLPVNYISNDVVNQRVLLYCNGTHSMLSSNLSSQRGVTVEDTKSVWYSKKQVQEWLDEMNDLGGDGLRIYFGAKEDTGIEPDGFEALPGQLCLIMMLTRMGSSKDSHINIIYEKLENFAERKQLTDDLKAANKDRSFNFGAYCPPICLTEGDDYPNDSVT